MILTVESVEIRDRNKKETQYVMKLKGIDENYVEATLTLKSDSKLDLQRFAPLMVGERRNMKLSLLDRKLDEFSESASDEELLEKRRQLAAEQGRN
jgi:hypothetical protein